MQNEPFKLRKRFRHEEEYSYLYAKVSWTKSILNVEAGTVLGRSPLRWLFLIIFYAIFYSGIVLLMFFCYNVFHETLLPDRPKWSLPQPGFSFQPSIGKKFWRIEYYEHLEAEFDIYVDRIIESLRKYGNITDDYYNQCKKTEMFGYKDRNPCIFLKINRMIGFKTKPIENVEDFPKEAPNELRNYLSALPEMERKNKIWVSCESSPSVEMKYFPNQFFSTEHVDVRKEIMHKDIREEYIKEFGFENAFFYNKTDYQRIIAVQLQGVKPHVEYSILCYLWAKNIIRDLKGKMGWGLVRVQLLVKI